MKKLLFFVSMLLISFGLFAQETVTLTFTAKQQNEAYQQLDSVKVMNLTRNWTEVLYYPDTVLTMNTVGIPGWENEKGSVKLYQNVPNPFSGITDFKLMLLNKEKVDLVVFDINGKKVAEYHNTLPSGEHQFRATMSTPQTYLLSAVTKNGNTSIKMINLSNTGEQARIEYISSLPLTVDMTKKHTNYEFTAGDNMQYVGYATQNDGVKDVTITQTQQGDEEITFTFPNETYDPIVNVTTDSAGNIETTSASLFGHYSIQYATATEIGFEWKLTEGGEYASLLATNSTASFTAQLKGLEPNTNYTFKAFVKTTDTTYYGEEKTFATEKLKETTVITGEATDINKRGATLHGSFTIGSENLMGLTMALKVKGSSTDWTEMGFAPATTSPFAITIENQLEPGTTYLYKAKATTVSGKEIYGEEKEFTTEAVSPEMPEVETDRANTSSYDEKAAQLNGKVISAGYCTMSETGFYMGTTENPAKDGQKFVSADPTATDFTYNTELLTPATTYYYVAFATNEVGTAYGEVKSFKTREAKALPEVVTVKVDAFSTSADVNCEVVSSGETVTERGICFSKSENPDTTATKVVDSNPKVGTYTLTANGLEENTTYYVKAYATSWAGIAYGDTIKFSTVTLSIPEVKTLSVDKVGSSSATVTSKLMVMGGSANLEVGVVCSDTVAEPTTENGLKFEGGSVANDSTFVTKANELKAETKYYARAYATNELGTAYGEVLEFTTAKAFACGDKLYDIDDNDYPTVLIGTQCWMADNLRVKTLPNGTPMVALTTSNCASATNAYAEVTDPVMEKTFVYYTRATAANGTAANLNQSTIVRGICPEGWHLPSVHEFVVMFQTIDSEWKCTSETITGSDATAAVSNNKLGIKLASKEGTWYYQADRTATAHTYSCEKPSDASPDDTYNTTPNTPGYSHPNYDDPDFNASGFNGLPFGYWNNSNGQVVYNGSGTYWTSISGSTNSQSRGIGIHYAKTGVDYSSSSTSGRAARGIRCICDKEFRNPAKPTVKTNETIDVTASSATLTGEVKSEGFCEMLERGFYYGTTENPVEEGTKIVVDTNINTFSYVLSELESSTTYYFAAFATNTMGTSYGEVLSFTTKEAASMAELQTKAITNLLATSLTVVCEVVNDGNEDVIERGVCYNTTGEPTVENTKATDTHVGVGEYNVAVTGLESHATYHFRAYAITKKGNAYGNELVQEMPEAQLPSVKVDSVYDVTKAAAMVAAQILGNGNLAITASGVVYDTLTAPTIEKNKVESSVTEGAFTVNLQKLDPNTKYYVRAYATNEMGTTYSEEVTFQTEMGAAVFSKCGDILTDIDENEYPTVLIGAQCWMAENLRVKTLPNGTPMVALTTSNCASATNAYAEVTDPVMGKTFVYYTRATAANGTAANTNQSTIVRGICPEGWHLPSVHEFVVMFQTIDSEWKCTSETITGSDATAAVSNNKLGIKLASKEGTWYYQADRTATAHTYSCEKPSDASPDDTYNTTPNTPGYSHPNYDDPDFNASGFNGLPFGYWNNSNGQVVYNGSGSYWTSISGSTNSQSRGIGIHYAKTGVDYSSSSTSGRAARGIRCICDESFE